MRPEPKINADSDEKFVALGLSPEWVAVIRKAGYKTVAEFRENSNINKLHQDLCGVNKKNKFGLTNPSKEEVEAWLK
jgi:lysyl-tRNA synthetase class 2